MYIRVLSNPNFSVAPLSLTLSLCLSHIEFLIDNHMKLCKMY